MSLNWRDDGGGERFEAFDHCGCDRFESAGTLHQVVHVVSDVRVDGSIRMRHVIVVVAVQERDHHVALNSVNSYLRLSRSPLAP